MSVSADELAALARMLRALGDPARLTAVALLAHGELCVCHLEAAMKLPQATVSRHLSVLRAAGVVESRRSGSFVHYRLAEQADPAAAQHLAALVGGFRSDVGLRRARAAAIRALGVCS